jgi:CheY-like chemotaxis protein
MQYQQKNIKLIVEQWGQVHFPEMFDVIILDLNMPISDGFEACKKINQLYDDVKLFKKEDNKENSTIGLIKDLKPLIFCCSGEDVTHPDMKKKLDESGFDGALPNPLTTPYLKDKLHPIVKENIL